MHKNPKDHRGLRTFFPIGMRNVASICLITWGLLWLLVLSQVNADFWGEGEEQLCLRRKHVAGKIKVHRVALMPRGSTVWQIPWCWSSPASHWPPWLSYSTLWPQLGCQLGKSCRVYLKRSFFARIEYGSDKPDSFENMKQFWRDQASIESVENSEMQSGLGVRAGWQTVAGRPVCFHGSVFPRQPSPLWEWRRRRGCKGQDCYAPARGSASYITRSDVGDTAGKQQLKCPVAIFSPDGHL